MIQTGKTNFTFDKLFRVSRLNTVKNGVRVRTFDFSTTDVCNAAYFWRGQNIKILVMSGDLDKRQRGGSIRRGLRFFAKREVRNEK